MARGPRSPRRVSPALSGSCSPWVPEACAPPLRSGPSPSLRHAPTRRPTAPLLPNAPLGDGSEFLSRYWPLKAPELPLSGQKLQARRRPGGRAVSFPCAMHQPASGESLVPLRVFVQILAAKGLLSRDIWTKTPVFGGFISNGTVGTSVPYGPCLSDGDGPLRRGGGEIMARCAARVPS